MAGCLKSRSKEKLSLSGSQRASELVDGSAIGTSGEASLPSGRGETKANGRPSGLRAWNKSLLPLGDVSGQPSE
jgi:hypothetical protein